MGVERAVKDVLLAAERRSRPARGVFGTLPDFLNIGVQKSGTTSLHQYLAQHPNVAMPRIGKELHFFDLNYGHRASWYKWYFPSVWSRQYRTRVRRQPLVAGECTPYYLANPLVPGRVKQLVPNAKLIALLRNPIDRAFSDYHHNVNKDREPLTFEQAIDQEDDRVGGERERLARDPSYVSLVHQRYAYTQQGHYADQLLEWMTHFRREQFLILNSERFFEDPSAVMQDVCRFLEIPDFALAEYPVFNAQASGNMAAATRARLVDHFRPHNERLYDLLGVDYGWDAP